MRPEPTVKRLMTFLGYPFEPGQLGEKRSNVSLSKTTQHKNLKKPINSSSVGRWKNELGQDEKRVFDEVHYGLSVD
jgi:hypothetical protein